MSANGKQAGYYRKLGKRIARNWELYLFMLPVVLVLFLFSYMPMYGVQIAFKDYKSFKGIWGSDWVGLKHFERFINLNMFPKLMKNTIAISVYSLQPVKSITAAFVSPASVVRASVSPCPSP